MKGLCQYVYIEEHTDLHGGTVVLWKHKIVRYTGCHVKSSCQEKGAVYIMRTLWAPFGTDVTGMSHPKSEESLPIRIHRGTYRSSGLEGLWKHTIVGYIHRMS